jgi:toxin ParE1/3/4
VKAAHKGRSPIARRVVWTEQALERLQEIEDFISQDAPERAADFVAKLIERGDSVAPFPNAGRVVPELGSNAIREVLEGSYRIVYRIAPERIEILTVFEGHRHLPISDLLHKE